MSRLLFFPILVLLITSTSSQNNICYANCRQGYCSLTNALSCTACDPGLLKINNNCVASNILPNPLTYLQPNSLNTLLDNSNNSVMTCSIIAQNQTATKMIFQPIIGNSFTQQFTIPTAYSFLQVKFNAIILSSNTYTQNLSVIVNVVPSDNLRTFISSNISTVDPTELALTCNGSVANYNNYYGVFFMDYQFSSNTTSIIIDVIPQGLTNSYLAVTDFLIYYGNCYQTCGTCTGPTIAQCNTCRGLLTTLTSGICTTCPTSFYQNITCWSCLPQCSSCSLSNKQVICTSCINFTTVEFNLTNGSCQSNQFFQDSLIGNQNSFNTTNWVSSEVANNPTSLCGYYQLLGGISIGVANSYFTYTITNLPAHSNIYIMYNLFLIDQNPLDSYQYQLSLDANTLQINFTIPAQGTNQCGGLSIQYLRPQRYSFLHNSTSALLTINVYKSYMGIRDFLITVDNPTKQNCLSESNGSCQACINGLVVVNQTCSGCLDGYYLITQNGIPYCSICPLPCSTCQYVNNTAVCTSCRQPLTQDGNYCVDSNNNLWDTQLLTAIPFNSQPIAWTYYPDLQNLGIDSCNSSQIIGTTTLKSKFLSMYRNFTNLPPHTGFILYFTFYQIDDNYFANNSLYFVLNSVTYTQDNISGIVQLSTLQMNLCGNTSSDSMFIMQFQDNTHTGATLDLAVFLTRMGKIGINNLQLYLLDTNSNTAPPFKIQTSPAYSVSSPPVKGLEVKLIFPTPFLNSINISNAFTFTILGNSRLMQQGYSNDLIVTNATYSQLEIVYILNLTQDYNSNNQLQVRAASQSSVYFASSNGQYTLISQAPVTTSLARYINVDQTSTSDRSNIRNLFNLFRGCAILAMFIGMASFLFGMSAAFDDFFILCQLIFVHVFILLAYNPPSVLIPFNGLQIVQFLQWLPSEARTSIQQGILPSNLYQYTPIIFQQYYQDVTFARTIYQTVLYFALLFGLWIFMHLLLLIYDSNYPNEKTKYQNFFVHYYKQYNAKGFVLLDKIVRFAYFTIAWACFLQFISFSNSPQSFHIWNSILTIVLFALIIVYPIIMAIILYRSANSLSDNTFNNVYQQIRVDKEKLFYYIFRYYKLIAIALVIAVCYQANPIIPLIILIVIHIIDAILLIALKPLGMIQQELIQAHIFYPCYPNIYYYTTVTQEILFVLLEIFFLILYGLRTNGSDSTYMGLGYAVCAFVILLLVNGLIRLVWGMLKILQYCYLEREANYMSVEKEVQKNQENQEHPILATDIRTQNQFSRRQMTAKMFSTKRLPTYVSKIR